MNKAQIEQVVGVAIIIIGSWGTLYLAKKVSKNWKNLEKRGENIAFLVSILFGAFTVFSVTYSVIYHLFHDRGIW